MNDRTTITLSRKAFSHNIAAINSLTGDSSCAVVVKSNAYGHGIVPMAQMAQSEPGVSWICTAAISEALPLRQQGISKPLLVLSYLDGNLEEAVRENIHLGISSFEEAEAIAAVAQKIKIQAFLHVKIDSGMGRLGLLADDAVACIHRMTKLPFITVYGVFTHLSDTGHDDTVHSRKQLGVFDDVLDGLDAAGIAISCTHALSSSSLNLVPRRRYSFTRAGAAIYGLWKSDLQKTLIQKRDPSFNLLPVLEWRARIIHLKTVPIGSPVGYKRTFITERQTVLALIGVGYWEGYRYTLSNKGVALVNGYEARVAGIVSMNITAFDVTDIPTVSVGDEVYLVGDAPPIRAHEVAQKAGCITNELITCLLTSLPRNSVQEHSPVVNYEAISSSTLAVTPERSI